MSKKSFVKVAMVALALGTVGLVSCGDDDSSNGSADNLSYSESTGVVELTPVDETEAMSTKPVVTIPEGNPPTDLVIEDLREGTGEQATTGSLLTVHYVGVSWSTGQQFDASWDRNDPFQLPLGQGMVIQGWELGLQGMKVGGQRRITIPPDLGYGAAGAGGVIGPNETLVFVVDLLSIG